MISRLLIRSVWMRLSLRLEMREEVDAMEGVAEVAPMEEREDEGGRCGPEVSRGWPLSRMAPMRAESSLVCIAPSSYI